MGTPVLALRMEQYEWNSTSRALHAAHACNVSSGPRRLPGVPYRAKRAAASVPPYPDRPAPSIWGSAGGNSFHQGACGPHRTDKFFSGDRLVAGETVTSRQSQGHTRRKAGSQRHGTLGLAGLPDEKEPSQMNLPSLEADTRRGRPGLSLSPRGAVDNLRFVAPLGRRATESAEAGRE